MSKKQLYNGWLRKKGRAAETPGLHDEITGAESVSDIILVDQQPVGRTPRANLLTYTRALDPLRKMLAATPEAIAKGFSTRHFSFNVPGGRCETCNGEGFERVEMQFLADVFVRCAQCGGKRFKEEVLDIKLRGISIGDMLEMSARQILDRFPENRQLADALEPVIAMGLDYICMGQPLSTLSGGEAQRLKLIRYLSGGQSGGAKLFILDEPTTGLHPDDISKLIRVLGKLVEKGNTVLVVEHNLDLLAACDWIIDLGPEGGERGGRIVCEGTPETVSGCARSITGRYLGKRLAEAGIPARPPHRPPPKAAGLSLAAAFSEMMQNSRRRRNLRLGFPASAPQRCPISTFRRVSLTTRRPSWGIPRILPHALSLTRFLYAGLASTISRSRNSGSHDEK